MMRQIERVLLYAVAVLVLCGLGIGAWLYLDLRPGLDARKLERWEALVTGRPAAFPTRVEGVAPYLGVPALVERPNAHRLMPYTARRAGMRVRYLRNIFSANQPEMAWFPQAEGGRQLLRWQTFDGKSGLHGIFPGNELELVDDLLYDFGVGTLFVKARHPNGATGFILLETLIGETEPISGVIVAADPERFLAHASVVLDGIRLYEQTVPSDDKVMMQNIAELRSPARYAITLSGGQPGGVHPLYATSVARGLLFSVLRTGVDVQTRQEAIAAVETFVAEYLMRAKREVRPGLVSWPYNFEWNINWGIKLTPPWYSPFVNSQVVTIGAMLHTLTGKAEYAKLAREAFEFIRTPIEQGGAEYGVAGFRLPAEYVYATPPLPNVRVLDGEFAVAVALYNGARLLGDSEMLRKSLQYFASLAMQLESYTAPNGDLYFAQYIEKMPEHYRWSMWALIQDAGIITKDRRFSEVARRLTPLIGKRWCDQYGC